MTRLSDYLTRLGSSDANDDTVQEEYLVERGAQGATKEDKETDFFDNISGLRNSNNNTEFERHFDLDTSNDAKDIMATVFNKIISPQLLSIMTAGNRIIDVTSKMFTLSDPDATVTIVSASGNGVTGTISDGSAITITGSGFGTGTANQFFEDFSNVTNVGDELTTSNTNFTAFDSNIPKAISDSRSGTRAFQGSQLKDGTYKFAGCQFDLDSIPTTEVFVSFAVKVPTGKRFPGNTTGPNVYSSDSSWKTFWLLGAGTPTQGSTLNDMVCPQHVGGTGNWFVSGNDLKNIDDKINDDDNSWFEFGQWNRMSTWLRAGAVPNVDVGDYYFQGLNPVSGMMEDTEVGLNFDGPTPVPTDVIFKFGNAPYEWRQIQVPGWIRHRTAAQGGDEVSIPYDDVYISWGTNAAARVELSNNATYTSSTRAAVCTYTSWSDTSISAVVREGDVNFAEDTWLHVIDGDNNVVTTYKVT